MSVQFLSSLLILLVLAGCGEKQHARESGDAIPGEGPEQSPPGVIIPVRVQKEAGIALAEVKKGMIEESILLPGRVAFDQRRLAHLTSRVAGRVEHLYAYLGDRVKSGELLATIYSPDYVATQSEFLQAEARLGAARTRRDSAELKTARAIFESVRRKLTVLGAAEKDLDELAVSRVPETYLEIRAPFAGTVTEAGDILGHFVQVGTTIFHIADLSTVWVTVDIREKDLPRVSPGMRAAVEVAAWPNEEFPGLLTRVFDAVDEQSRAIKGRVELQNRGGKLKPEMFANVRVKTRGETAALLVPSDAVQFDGESSYLFVARNDTLFEKRPVRVLKDSGGMSAILEGLKPGERVVVAGAFTVKSEMLKRNFSTD